MILSFLSSTSAFIRNMSFPKFTVLAVAGQGLQDSVSVRRQRGTLAINPNPVLTQQEGLQQAALLDPTVQAPEPEQTFPVQDALQITAGDAPVLHRQLVVTSAPSSLASTGRGRGSYPWRTRVAGYTPTQGNLQ